MKFILKDYSYDSIEYFFMNFFSSAPVYDITVGRTTYNLKFYSDGIILQIASLLERIYSSSIHIMSI